MITQSELKDLFYYNQLTGEFTRIKNVSNVKCGLVVLKPSKQGYLRLRINNKYYYLHRLAWLYVYGEFPNNLIDHKNGNKLDNRIDNLRLASYSENYQNISLKSKASSGLRGAYYNQKSNKWQAKLTINYKTKSLGYFETALLAHHAYLNGKKKYHTFNPEFIRWLKHFLLTAKTN